ncbi:MAG TPA: hypothetical protein VMF08_01215, partial [Candidatus Sulfotelmatobacter sp.]|nr:hypothetical protein [Candidatus Sulfotelmatobacter sp.]
TALVIVAENLCALLRRVMGTITGRIFHTLTLTELPQPCLAGVSNTDTTIQTTPAVRSVLGGMNIARLTTQPSNVGARFLGWTSMREHFRMILLCR